MGLHERNKGPDFEFELVFEVTSLGLHQRNEGTDFEFELVFEVTAWVCNERTRERIFYSSLFLK
jgi:hypothetical protein